MKIEKTNFFPVEIHSFFVEKQTCEEILKIVKEEKDNWSKNLLNVKAKTSGWDGLRFPIIKNISNFCCETVLPKIHSLNNWSCEEAWVNVYEKGDYTEVHNHASKKYSAILIVKSKCNALVFKNIANMYSLCNFKKEHQDEKILEKDGLFIFFPSWLFHYVEKCTDERITVAFNFYNEEF